MGMARRPWEVTTCPSENGSRNSAKNTAGPRASSPSSVGGDARQISRYENGRITPSLDALVRIAEVLDISLDYLVIENAPRRPLHVDRPRVRRTPRRARRTD